MTEEQTPHIAEKPKNRKYALEPNETSCGLHAQEVAGSSPAAPTTSQRLALFFGGLPRRLPCPRPIRSSTMIACSTFSRSVRRSASILLTSIAAMIAEFPGWEPSVLLATSAAKILDIYFAIWNESTTSPVSDTCFRRKVLPSMSTTLSECTEDMNLSVKPCQLPGSVCCSGL